MNPSSLSNFCFCGSRKIAAPRALAAVSRSKNSKLSAQSLPLTVITSAEICAGIYGLKDPIISHISERLFSFLSALLMEPIVQHNL